MKISKLQLKNFRGYDLLEVNFDKNFNVIIGRNDIGKSTILEALDIFFEGGTIKADIDDCNVHATERAMSISVSFLPEDKDYTIDTVPTNLKSEFLLDKDGFLTLKKHWDCSKDKLSSASLKTYLVSNYPSIITEPLINEKITDLRKILDSYKDVLNVDEVKRNTSSAIRQAIYSVIDTSQLSEIEVAIDKEDGKKIWDALKNDLPLFFLFQSDRQNKDSDKEVQDPLKAITKTAISQLEDRLEEVKVEIIKKAEEIGRETIAKLSEMNPEIASILSPQMSSKAWDSLFSFSFNCDDGIPINKRGSGVRRLILLNYFRAEAERKNTASKNIIYAIEEPETSQHPDWQIELFNALIKLADNPSTQVITTTHSPSLAGLVKPEKIIFLYKKDKKIVLEYGNESNLEKIARTLGLLPDVSVVINDLSIKAILCLEGPNDIDFFNHYSKLFEIDFENEQKILVLALGGGTLMHWVNKNYLKKLNKPEIHIYDNDVSQYQAAVDEINTRDGCWATLTQLREIENYIHPSIYKQVYPITEDFHDPSLDWQTGWKQRDIPKELSVFLRGLKAAGNTAISNEGASSIKWKLSKDGAQHMTKELLIDLGVYNEVEGWFNKIKEKIQ